LRFYDRSRGSTCASLWLPQSRRRTSEGRREADIRESEADIRRADAVVAKARASMAERIAREAQSVSSIPISDPVVQELLKQASPAIAELRGTSLIERVTIGLSK
jgi:hypothetical protein